MVLSLYSSFSFAGVCSLLSFLSLSASTGSFCNRSVVGRGMRLACLVECMQFADYVARVVILLFLLVRRCYAEIKFNHAIINSLIFFARPCTMTRGMRNHRGGALTRTIAAFLNAPERVNTCTGQCQTGHVCADVTGCTRLVIKSNRVLCKSTTSCPRPFWTIHNKQRFRNS